MTGMKEGVGDNPFERDDLVDEGPDEEPEPEEASESSEATATTTEASRSEPTTRASKQDIPYIYRRDRVTDERDQIPFYLREGTIDVLEERLLAFEEQLGEDVSKIDFRELALLVGVEHLDEMQTRAQEWGYGME
jgi:hypothetical protein